ncbi:M1 family metallopeptidase [Actinacidiphila oryziradicis]|uniref:M1 family peptidase n=1 Tax=Actinacidiphila oryziradicis TaxID=2571141 RepID=A0A4U0RWY6_9ACTN|nr:M1 family metallopeptidase [Actinacidiphila oryziradicis]TKA00836.1 M1 family peptidase [Actinacidiphila oryziradicis]
MRPTPHKTLAASALAVAALAGVSLPVSPAAAVPHAAPLAAACTPAQVVANGGFESSTSPWSQSSTGVITNRAGQSAHGGTNFAWLDGVGSTHTDTLSQSVTIPSGCSSATLSFWLHIDTAETTSSTAYDKLTAKIGTTTLATYSNLDKNTGYVQKSFDVSAFAGQTVNVAFAGTEDSSLQTSFVVDDVGITVPSGADRFGYDGAFSLIGNALPVLAVKDAAGWHLDPYTNNGESFYSLSADFSVALDHPSTLLVPATGTSVDTPGSSGRTITTATASKVRDFAWAAGPFSKISGTSTAGTPVNVYSVSGISSADAQSMLTTAKSAVDAHASRFGAYPYGELDAVIDNNFWFGGMEYPGFVLDLVSTTALTHEIGHQWWYGIVGDDEYNSPWLDEAFTDYSTDLALSKTGTGCWNSVSWASTAEKITNSMAYWDAHSSRYSTVVYGYGKCALHDLRRVLGDSVMAKLLKDFATSHWYGVSTTSEFKAAAQAATSTDLTPFWTQHRVDG